MLYFLNLKNISKSNNVKGKFFVKRKRFRFSTAIQKQIRKDFLVNFFENTTIGGLRQLFGRNQLPNVYKVLWLIMWLSMVVFASILCSNGVSNYLKYDVKTTIHYETMDQLEFPAITICSENFLRRSAAGGSFFAMIALATWFTTDPSKIASLAKENNRTCFTPNKSAIAEQFDKDNVNLFKRLGMAKVMQLSGMGLDVTAVKCWWDSTETNCKATFMNHLTDKGWCYTFNPAKRYYGFNLSLELEEKSLDTYVNYAVTTAGQQGLQLLLNVSQEEYCGAVWKYYANAGFAVKLHSPEIQPSMLDGKLLYFSPGFRFDIVIKPTYINRNTEHIGRCISKMDLSLDFGHGVYFKEECLIEGFMILIWNQCHCLHFTFEGSEEKLSKALNIPMSNISICSGDGLACVRVVGENAANSPPEQVFSNCKVPCFEIKYDYQMSRSIFPSQSKLDQFSAEFAMNRLKLRKDLVLISFRFESLIVEIIDENQKYTVLDVFRYFGGILSLFLGVSVICLGEIFLFIMHYMHTLLILITDKINSRKKVNNVTFTKNAAKKRNDVCVQGFQKFKK